MSAQNGCLFFEGTSGRRWTIATAEIGGLPIAVIDRAKSTELMIDLALKRRNSGLPPFIFTSANGQVLSICDRQPQLRELFLETDLIQADGMSLVFASRLFQHTPLPERICTTDLFQDIAQAATRRGASFFFLGATKSMAEKAAQRVRAFYPDLEIVGHASGYMRREGDEDRVVDAVNAAKPDILWLGLGVPNEQLFAARNRRRLQGVGLIKTCGGLFDVLSGKNTRAPSWMRTAGLEWAYRLYLEPRRLAGRYLTTNPHALFVLLTRTGLTSAQAWK
jgi:N-acetylglucosaminyldiphosphoundecaprenol N-acetyl-beta-D-mannosaminyltransferase